MNIINNEKHIPYIDGCRGTAIAIVVLGHAGLGKIIPGKFGVTLFFFISGFLITKLLLLEMNRKGSIGLKNFYLRRFFRLYPALICMILISYVTARILQCDLPWKDIIAAVFYGTNYYIGWIRPPVADCARLLDIIWSLSVEEHFYLFFPFIFQLFLKKDSETRTKNFVRLLVVLCILAFAARVLLYAGHSNDLDYVSGRAYFSTHTRMDSILWGCLAALLLYRLQATWYLSMLTSKKYFAIGLILLLLSVAIRNEAFRQTLLFSFQGMGLFLLVPALAFMEGSRVRKILETNIMIFAGKISYSLYLFHWVAAKIANHYTVEWSFGWQLIFWPLTLALSLSSYYFVEQPFVALRRKFGSQQS